ncbi:hypothetical protein EJV47_06940 [Hymenobacter gummosus]|uniref:Uncharacterized protein n=1 Tax=Hymenobacter gummosus TaxID=1776032 RepID=A0A3S0JFN3_9BACT|nr:hypothetical protein [Hymenobacter gummosus]RTQ51530.1 hypothetical protein EJV47_06940 [Hymenobacter gummosus]
MFSAEVLAELQELVRRLPGLTTLRIRYTRSALLLTTNLPDEDGYAGVSMFLFFLLAFCASGISIAAMYRAWGVVAAGLLAGAGLGYLLYRINRRINNSGSWPPNFIVDAATRRLTLPAPSTWWTKAAAPEFGFEQVADIQARLLWTDTGYGEGAEVTLRLRGGHSQPMLTINSYAFAQQLAVVLRLIVHAPEAAEA